jgi:tetratricopeptide (TPR) repeat protein/tRNA A-37 threonylcarbamoyl transferase component Bud32
MSERELFLAAIEIRDLQAKARYLDQACAGDAALRAKVEALLKSHEEAGSFLEEPAAYDMGATVAQTRPIDPLANISGDTTGTGSDRSPEPTQPESAATEAYFHRPVADATLAPDHATGDGTPDADSPTLATDGHTPSRVLPRGTNVRYFGDYEVQKELGRGGMGVVYKARQVTLNRPVALKMIKAGVLADDAELRRFQNEAEAVALLDHPGIVPVYEVGEHDGQRYFSMKLVEGGNLAEQLGSFKDNPKAAATLLALAAEAVHHAHMRGILHRDLKPANILMDIEGHPHLTDFGLAKRVETDIEMTASGSILGTPAYMSPEQAAGHRGTITTATDIYGLGAILYSLLTSKAPFGGESVIETLDAVRNRPPEPPTKFNDRAPRDLETICLKCLEKDSRRRYASAPALADDLHAWLDSRPITARRVGGAERAWLWCKRKPAIAALTAAVFVALVGGITAAIAVQARANGVLRAKNGELSDANNRITKANAELSSAKERVKQRFDLANEAIKLYHGQVGDDLVLKADQFKPLRDKLLTGAAAFYIKLEGLLKDQPDRISRVMMGNAYFEHGELTEKIGNKAAALEAHHKGLAIRRELASESPADLEAKFELATSLFANGGLFSATGKSAAALTHYELARDLLVGLPAVGPGSEGRRNLLGRAYHAIATELETMGKTADALTSFRLALAISQKLADENPSVTEFRSRLAGTMHNMANVLKSQGRTSDALAMFEQARANSEMAVRADGAVTAHKVFLANHHDAIGALLSQTGRMAEALESYRRALAIRQKLADDNPAVTQFRSGLAAIHNNIGQLRSQTGNSAEALESFSRALAVFQKLADENPSVTEFSSGLAVIHGNIGRLQSQTGKAADALVSYRRVQAILRKLAEDNPAATEFQSSLASNCTTIGWLQAEAGKQAEALESYRQALAIFRKLAGDNPRITAFRAGVAGAHYLIAYTLRDTGDTVAALDSHGQALAIFQKLADDNPTVVVFRYELARCHHSIGYILGQTGELTAALVSFRRSLAINQTLADDNPSVLTYRNSVAYNHGEIGQLLSKNGQTAEAMESYRRALAINQKLSDENPAGIEFQRSLAFNYDGIGKLHQQAGHPALALESHLESLAIRQKLAGDNPPIPGYRNDLAGSQTNLADVFRTLGRAEEARAGYQRAIAIREELVKVNPNVPTYRANLGYSVRRLGLTRLAAGDVAGSVVDARKAIALYESLPCRLGEEQYELACCHAALAAAAGRESSGISANDGGAEADQAMTLLREAVIQGYRNTNAMSGESALDSLRNRHDFQLLMLDLAFPPNPFAQ